MTLLTKDAILAAKDLQVVDVDVPEWGGKVQLRPMTAGEREVFEQEIVSNMNSKNRPNNIRAFLVHLSLVDEQGNLLFTKEEVDALGKKSAVVLNRLALKCQEINGMTTKEVEELEKN